MMRSWLALIILCSPIAGWSAMTIHIIAAPQLTPLLDTIYVAGTFNNWDENNSDFMCSPNANGWSVAINGEPNTPIEFKFTRGTWSTVEGDEQGAYIGNRLITYIENGSLEVSIAGWEDLPGAHTVSPSVRILDSNFYIPQLNRTRRIWLKLPLNDQSPSISYPVCYVLDGQNSMDQATSFAGEWGIDEAMDEFEQNSCSNTIVVAIDNGGIHRIDEYSPWYNTEYNEGGEGDAFAQFIALTLKPYIDEHFSTLSSGNETTIVGSSLGALLGTYLMCTYPEKFGRGGLFSPAYWFNPELLPYAQEHPVASGSRIYFVAGTTESTDMVPDMQNMQTTIENAGNNPATFLITHADGAHSEWYWNREFPDAYLWLSQCESSPLLSSSLADHYQTTLFPNPVVDTLTIETTYAEKVVFFIHDENGKALHHGLLDKKTHLQMDTYSAGKYTFVLRSTDGKIIFQETIVKL